MARASFAQALKIIIQKMPINPRPENLRRGLVGIFASLTGNLVVDNIAWLFA
ncbi:Hypothetical protein LOCK908_0223 [Lacticaseibacillus rhamnosus LOCK908]|uniref:Uncharacterized protein n=1 Tax=Lacticaseibacillus rhamnosus (strain LMS2-1) TaxID=525361 RepID=C2JTA2_LACRM|nr:conserved hypothetical protein [Lacticaseibacillus rhamnosus ATCC 8530]AGP72910.1 Hypothetical protein LOCK908_0223 [Lacticaseibacillus rhamnosus LOCK908]EEN81678.1 hypothetical protein HMPREF0539_0136 [Lacticaseibacillus rhamnosus LMS2-1]KRK30295.1 hypothetical protein Q777_GL000785 [Lacticaseibacillus rhamnosus DSM 20021 = JCM 1136 = NBRC 3425]CAR89055.1 Putative protein without homology [Lacticaseibacillus rhamnosus Lc 705]